MHFVLVKRASISQGWLQKRGERIRNWRPRYFILFNDGSLLGFRVKPDHNNPQAYIDPLNDFTVKDAQTMRVRLFLKGTNAFRKLI